MRTAITKDGKALTASASAVAKALCPHCGGVVKLRKRRLMGGGLTYFWRHQDNRHPYCQERSKPVK